MRFLSRLDDFENIIIDGSVSTSGLSSVYIKDATTPILRIGSNTGDSFITYDGTELSVSSDVDLRLTTPTDQDVFLITSSGNIVTTQGGGNFTIGGGLTLGNFGAGLLQTDASGVVSLDTNTYLTAEADTLDSVTDRGATTTNDITVGNVTSTGTQSIFFGSTGGSTPTISRRIVLNGASDGSETLGIQYRGLGTQNTRLSVFLDPANKQFIHNDTWSSGGGIDAYLWQRTGNTKFTLNALNGNLIVHSGNVGIGTTNPSENLHIASSGEPKFILESHDGTQDCQVRFRTTRASTTVSNKTAVLAIGSTDSAGSIVETLFLNNNNVGIGTNNPLSKLHVSGAIRTDNIVGETYPSNSFIDFDYDETAWTNSVAIGSIGSMFYLADTNNNSASTTPAHQFFTATTDIDTATALMTIRTDGNVGIGLTGPTEKLHVSGNILATGTITASNFSGSSSGTNTGDQTTITGNAGSATVLQTARTLTIGNTGKTFDGSANVSWTLAEIGAYAATNPAGYTTNTGTVTSVSGAGGYGGLTLTGTVTTSGDITLGGTPTGTWPISVSGNAATATEVSRTVTAGSEANVVSATIGTNDFFRIRTGGVSNGGFVEIATADDGTEPILVRQYTGTFATIARTASILDASGNTSFPGTLTASNFSGSSSGTNTGDQTTITGNAGSATVLQTARTINGTSFDGSANITTSNWGTTRTVTIGNTGKSVNGSANVSWSLAEIGAQPAGSYLTAEADTLATVTGRGASTTDAITVRGITSTKDSAQLIINRVDTTGATWSFYSWADGLNIFPNAAKTIYIGRDGSNTDLELYNGNLRVLGTGTSYFAGNVGIGTTNPQVELHVKGNNGWGEVRVEGQTFASGHGGSLEFYSEGTALADIYANTSKDLILRTNGTTERMRITSAGTIVAGGTASTPSGSETANYLWVASQNRMYVSSSGTSATFNRHSSAGTIVGFDYAGTGVGSFSTDGTNLSLNAASSNILSAGGSERMRITAAGNVGIGTASPTTKLHVVGTAETRLRVGSSNATSNVVLELRDENTPTGQGTVITYNNATGETYFNNALSTATTDFHFQSGEYGTASDFFALSNAGGNSIVQLSTTTGDAFITYEDAINELAIASDGDLRLTTPTDQDVFFISSGGNIDMTQAGGVVDMGGNLIVDGQVGIGVSPAEKLHVNGNILSKDATGNYREIRVVSQGSAALYGGNESSPWDLYFGDDLWFEKNSSILATIKASNGNFGVNTTNPLQKLHVSGGHMVIENTYGLYLNGSDTNWQFGRNIVTDSGFLTSNTVQVKVFNGATQGFQVVNSGNTAIFEVEGSTGRARVLGGFAAGNITPSATAGRIDASNDIVAYSTSDNRLKENIKPIDNALDKVKSLTGVEFDWKEETKDVHGYEGHDIGVIAQDVQAVLPEAVRTGDNGYLSVRYEKMIALLIESNKELAMQVEVLKQRLDGLTK